MSEIHIHILGAGKPFKGSKNNALRKATNTMKVLDWQLQELSSLKANINYIGGYKYNDIVKKYPYLNFKINPFWESSGPVSSLLFSKIESNHKNIFCYGDILFQSEVIKKINKSNSDIVISIDKNWINRYKDRSEENLCTSEKVKIINKKVINIGSSISLEEANAEFAGVVLFNQKVSSFINSNLDNFKKRFKNTSLVDFISYLISNNFSIDGIDINKQWAELNNSNDLTNFIFGTKAQTLKKLSKFLKKSKIQNQYCFTVKNWSDNPEKVIKNIKESFKVEQLVIRSSSNSEDTFESANAGKYKSVLNVKAHLDIEIKNAIQEVIDSYEKNNDKYQNQVLVQPMVLDTKISGVVFTHTLSRGSPYYVINYDDETGSTDSITSGKSINSSTIVISRNKIKSKLNLIPNLMENLLPAIREIEDLLDFSYLDIEFSITEDKKIHLFQVRPIAVQYKDTDVDDNEIYKIIDNAISQFKFSKEPKPFVLGDYPIFGLMPDWNPAEIIGTKPSKLAFTIYCFLITDEVWAIQREQYGYRDLRPNKLLRYFAGQPYIDVRASINSFIPKKLNNKLAKRLINFYSKRLVDNPDFHDKLEFEVMPTCFSLDFDKWEERLYGSGYFNKLEIKEYLDSLKSITINSIKRIDTDKKNLKKLLFRFEEIRKSNSTELDKAIMLLDDCKNYGTLPFAHLARAAFISISILNSAVKKKVISQEGFDSFLSSIKTVSHEFTEDLKLLKESHEKVDWKLFFEKYGHLRPGTYDITSLSYFEAQEKYLSKDINFNTKKDLCDVSIWNKEKVYLFDNLRQNGIEFSDNIFEQFLYSSIEGREYSKFVFTKNLSKAFDYIIKFGENIGLDRKKLSHMPLNTFYEYQKGIINNVDVKEILSKISLDGENQRKIENHIELPLLITKEEDFYAFQESKSKPNFIGTKLITGPIKELTNFDTNDQDVLLEGKIIIVENADPGFDWIFANKILGLITMFGGGNSHMAIRAAEFQLPAAIGVGVSLYKELCISNLIELDCNKKTIKIIR